MKKYLYILIVVVSIMLMGCKKDEVNISELVTFSNEEGIANGIADFKTETPDINISNIRSYVGEDIDYSSKIDVKNLNEEIDFQMWVDASKVDIFKKGDYEAVYKFVYDKKTIEKKIIVSIVEKEETAASNNLSENSTKATKVASSEKATEKATKKTTKKTTSKSASASSDLNNSEITSNITNAANVENAANGVNDANAGNSATVANGANGSNSTIATTSPSKNTVSASKVMVTSASNNITTKIKNLGYMNIELLSGSTVKIKCTTTKYIVSTRTDVSTITKNGENYKVSKLIIKYNTGDEQILETNQVKIN